MHRRIKEIYIYIFPSLVCDLHTAQIQPIFMENASNGERRRRRLLLREWIHRSRYRLPKLPSACVCCEAAITQRTVPRLRMRIINSNKKWIVQLTSQIKRKSCCSTRNNSQVVLVTTVLSRGRSCNIDSPKVAPTPKLHKVTGIWNETERQREREININSLERWQMAKTVYGTEA